VQAGRGIHYASLICILAVTCILDIWSSIDHEGPYTSIDSTSESSDLFTSVRIEPETTWVTDYCLLYIRKK